jgi:hypothetical protein
MQMASFYKLYKTTNLQQFSGYDPNQWWEYSEHYGLLISFQYLTELKHPPHFSIMIILILEDIENNTQFMWKKMLHFCQ